jgi:predicted transcriptional regulator
MSHNETTVITVHAIAQVTDYDRNRLTQEALADVDTGNVVDHQSVQAWADSLGASQKLPIPR